MLLSFKIHNFKSILDLDLDLSYAEGSAPNGYRDLQYHPFFELKKERFVPVLSIYGANASGKSNILKAMYRFFCTIVEGVKDNYLPNKINPKYNSTMFEVKFSIDKNIYIYNLEYNKEEILNESLKFNEDILFNCSNNYLEFIKTSSIMYDQNKMSEIYNVECKNSKEKQIYTFLSKLKKNYENFDKRISSVYDYMVDKVDLYMDNKISLSRGIEKLAKHNNSEEIIQLNKITNIIKKLDIDINAITFETNKIPLEAVDTDILFDNVYESRVDVDGESLVNNLFKSYHKNINGEEVVFNFIKDESEGTKAIAGLLGTVLLTLDMGGVLFVDELEQSLHPLLLLQIIRMFKDKEYNKNNAQLIFTTHNTDILENDVLRVSEVMITNKTIKKGTVANRISDYEDIRNVNNFRKRYLKGEFDGIPYPYL